MICIVRAAQQEIDEAFEYYESQMPGLGSEFIEEFEKAIHRIEQFPEAWHPFSTNTRRCQFNRFPYGIVYHIDNKQMTILAIAHMHRQPNYWQDRLSDR
jgi:toxin ParE2